MGQGWASAISKRASMSSINVVWLIEIEVVVVVSFQPSRCFTGSKSVRVYFVSRVCLGRGLLEHEGRAFAGKSLKFKELKR